MATCAYVDLNPAAAGMAQIPEESDHTSVKARVEHCREQGRMEELQSALQQTAEGRTLSPDAARRLEQQLWLCPFSNDPSNPGDGAGRRGMISGFSLAQYLQLVDWTSHLVREGKASVSAQALSSPIHSPVVSLRALGRLRVKNISNNSRGVPSNSAHCRSPASC